MPPNKHDKHIRLINEDAYDAGLDALVEDSRAWSADPNFKLVDIYRGQLERLEYEQGSDALYIEYL